MISDTSRAKLDELLWAFADCKDKVTKMSIYDKIMNMVSNFDEMQVHIDDTVYVIAKCEDVKKETDISGNKFCSLCKSCPYFDENGCRDNDFKILETKVTSIYSSETVNGYEWFVNLDNIKSPYTISCVGSSVFKSRKDAEANYSKFCNNRN